MVVILVGFYILFPVLAIWLCFRYEFFNKIGAVIICYLVGITVGNIGIIPESVFHVQESISEAAVALALPLLLFSMNVRHWLRIAGKALLSMLAATITIIAVAFVGYAIINDQTPDAWKLGGMAIGVYTGGTPNLAAIKTALNVDSTTFIIIHTYDTFISLIYLIFCMSVAQRIFNIWLPRFSLVVNNSGGINGTMETEDIQSYAGMFRRRTVLAMGGATLLSLLIVGMAMGLAGLVPQSYATSMAILTITTGGIACSFIPKIRNLEKTFQLGMYIILVFCLVVGSMANLKDLININWSIMFFVCFCIFGSLLLHGVFCWILKIDTDTYIITSVSAICSPPFVPVVAGALKNKEIILSGLTTGIIGYAVGNYLGISLAYVFKAMLG